MVARNYNIMLFTITILAFPYVYNQNILYTFNFKLIFFLIYYFSVIPGIPGIPGIPARNSGIPFFPNYQA